VAVRCAHPLATGWKFRWSNPGGGRDFTHISRRALGSTQLPIQWVPGFFPGGKAVGVWRWPPTRSSAEVKERIELYLYLSGPSWPVLGWTWTVPYTVAAFHVTDSSKYAPVSSAWPVCPSACSRVSTRDPQKACSEIRQRSSKFCWPTDFGYKDITIPDTLIRPTRIYTHIWIFVGAKIFWGKRREKCNTHVTPNRFC